MVGESRGNARTEKGSGQRGAQRDRRQRAAEPGPSASPAKAGRGCLGHVSSRHLWEASEHKAWAGQRLKDNF